MKLRILGSFVIALALAACGGTVDPDPATTSSRGEAIGVASTCDAVTDDGTPVAILQVAEAPPAATGGTLTNGRYHLTSVRQYTGAGGASGELTDGTMSSTLTIDGELISIGNTEEGRGVSSTSDSNGNVVTTRGPVERRSSARLGTVHASGNRLTIASTCVAGRTETMLFAADATSVTFLITDSIVGSLAITYSQR